MQMLKDLYSWFFATPTAITATISIILATVAYLYQRKEKRKNNAYIIAQNYAKDIIPRLRIIKLILSESELAKYFKKFEAMKKFDSTELSSFLVNEKHQPVTIEYIENSIDSIDEEVIKEIILKNECLHYENRWHSQSKTESYNSKMFVSSFRHSIIDFLNELEAMALLFRYNIADEKIVYQSLHQTLLNNCCPAN